MGSLRGEGLVVTGTDNGANGIRLDTGVVLGGSAGGGEEGDFVMTVGVSGNNNAGYSRGSFGALDPDTLLGEDFFQLYATSTGTDRLIIEFGTLGDVQLTDVDALSVTIEGAADNPYYAPWSGARTAYDTEDGATALETYLDGQEGNDLDVVIETLQFGDTYTGTLTVGSSGQERGFDTSYGALGPFYFNGQEIEGLYVDLSAVGLRLISASGSEFTGPSAETYTDAQVVIDGFDSNNPIDITYISGGSYQEGSSNTALWTYLNSTIGVGNDVGIEIVFSEGA